jgi:hypothetical protein
MKITLQHQNKLYKQILKILLRAGYEEKTLGSVLIGFGHQQRESYLAKKLKNDSKTMEKFTFSLEALRKVSL